MKQTFNDSSQSVAINLEPDPAIIIAGPGSGKTFTITHRIEHLIKQRGIRPSEILVITFTKSAALEMKERFNRLNISSGIEVSFATFHSFFYSILKSFSPGQAGNVIGVNQKNEILSKLIHSNILYKNSFFTDLENLSSLISNYKNNIEKFDYSFDFNEAQQAIFESIYEEYNRMLKAVSLIDFDDILLLCYKLLLENFQIRNRIKERYKALLIDEFQDINEIQYEIVKMIYPNNQNIYVVGDDDQSIYGFRGARPSIMKSFIVDFNVKNIIELNKNYRSCQCIIDYTHKLICHNSGRLKNRKAVQGSDIANGENVGITGLESGLQQLEYISKYLSNIPEDCSVAILTRTNKSARDYYEAFMLEDKTGQNEILKAEIAEDIKAYIDVCISGNRSSYLRIVNKPLRYISPHIFSEETIDIKELINKSCKTSQAHYLTVFSKQIQALKGTSSFTFVRYLFNIIGYKEYITEKYPQKKDEIVAILQELEKEARNHAIIVDFGKILNGYTDLKSEKKSKHPNLSIMTFHSSKGLEYDYVIIPDVNEGKIPGRISLRNDNSEEERRLFYVAMTRAKRGLLITYIKKEESSRLLPSRFIYELLE